MVKSAAIGSVATPGKYVHPFNMSGLLIKVGEGLMV